MISDKQKITVAAFLLAAFLSYTYFIYRNLPVKSDASAGIAAANGKLLWQRKNCNSCHQIYGLGGYLGPDLTNVYSRQGADYIKAFLVTGTVTMPQFRLSQKELDEIVAFLKQVDASGTADPKSFKINYDGFIHH